MLFQTFHTLYQINMAPDACILEKGIEPNNEGSGSVRFVQPDGSVRFGFGCQNLWVRSVRFEMVSEWSLSSVWVRFDSHL